MAGAGFAAAALATASAQFLTVFVIMEKRPLSLRSQSAAWAGQAAVDFSALLTVGGNQECLTGVLRDMD